MLLTKYIPIIFILLILAPPFTEGWRRRRRRRTPLPPPVTCPAISSSSHRWVSCTNGYNLNSRCTFSCSTGYYNTGVSSVVCQSNSKWSASCPTCAIRTCGHPPTPTHGTTSCPHYNYGATCSFGCISCYSLSGSNTRYCNGYTWSGTTPSCRDTQPPSFSNCPKDIVTNNDDRTTSAVVIYPTPSASDNCGRTPSVTKISGQNSGTSFSGGAHTIMFRATDENGNHADCTFSIIVNAPALPYRDDNHCGGDWLAPNGKVAQCDPDGIYPCCSPYNWCGITTKHCDCTGCVDYRVTVPALRYRDDNRCGGDWLAPNGEVAQCDPDGIYPCCSPHNWCGITTKHCNCTECVDYRVTG